MRLNTYLLDGFSVDLTDQDLVPIDLVAGGLAMMGSTASVAAIAPAVGGVLAGKGQTVAIGSMFTIGASASNPAYLIVSGLDRTEYTKGYSTAAMGHLAAGTKTQGFTDVSGDAWSVGVVFTYSATTGQYTNSTYGSLSQLSFATGTNLGDTTTFTLFGTSSAATASAYAANPLIMLNNPSIFSNYGSVAVVTQTAAATPPGTATPGGIASAAMSYVGAVWNEDGCWVLASDISAKAGATLPITSAVGQVPGIGNSAWFVAYNGPVAANANWVSALVPGEIVGFITTSGGGHITTVVSGQGSSANLVDNITYTNASGGIANSAGDGVAADVIVQAPHAASQEFSGVNAAYVVVYELDCPVVVASVASISVNAGAAVSLAADFSASNPKAGQSVTQYQIYETNTADTLMVGGAANTTAVSAATACTVASLSGLSVTAGSTVNSDVVEVRASNGLYWGDWVGITVNVGASGPLTVAQALLATGSSAFAVSDTAANITANVAKLQTLAASGRITGVTITGGGTVTLTLAQLTSAARLVAVLPATGSLNVTGATVAQASALQSNAQVGAFTIADSSANVSAALDSLQTLAAAGKLSAITLASVTAPITLSVAQVTSDARALALIGGSYQLALTGASVSSSATLAAVAHVQSVSISDSAANVQQGLAGLQTLAAAGKLGAITLSDGGTPVVTVSAANFVADSSALAKIVSAFKVAVTGAAVAQAAGLQSNAQVSGFTIADTAANVTGKTVLAADTKLTAIAVTGTSAANTLNLTGISAPVAVNLSGNTATASGGLGAATMSFVTPPDVITLGTGAAAITAGLGAGCGIEVIGNFQFGVDQLSIGLGTLSGLSAFDTTYNGQHAVALSGGSLTTGVVLANQANSVTASSVLSGHVHVSGGVALVS